MYQTMTLGRLKNKKAYSQYGTYGRQTSAAGSPTKMAFNLEVEVWLKTLELEEYTPLFKPFGNVQDLLHWNEKNLLDIGIRNAAHRARLISNLVYIREKLKRTSTISGAGLPPLSSTPPRSPRNLPSSSSSSSSGGQPPTSPSNRLQFRYSTIPEDHPSKPPSSPVRNKMSLLQDMSPDELRKELEEEFKLPNEDVRSHAWFHGGISRDKADRLVRENGDFLVRDSISKPGNFVLTVRWKNTPMHFVINKVVLKAHSPYASVQYQFEKECFDTIPSLIKFYVGNCRPVSQASGAVIQRPINRTLPLSYTDSKYAAFNKSHTSSYTYGQLQKKVVTPRRGSINGNDGLRQRSGSNPTSLNQLNGSADRPMVNRADSQPLLGRTSPSDRLRDYVPVGRTGSEPILSPSKEFPSPESDYAETKPCLNTSVSDEEVNVPKGVPTEGVRKDIVPTEGVLKEGVPKEGSQESSPVRTIPQIRHPVREHIYSEIDQPEEPVPIRYTMLHDDNDPKPDPAKLAGLEAVDVTDAPPVRESDESNLDVKPRRRVHSDTRFSVLDGDYSQVAQRTSPNHLQKIPDKLQTILLVRETESVFQPREFSSPLLEADNKPLDKTLMDTVRQMLLEANPLSLARHLTLVDTEVCRIGHGSNNNSMPGLELLCLPHGARFRQDILERHHCLKMFCMASLLTCDDPDVRVQVLHQWIQLAETLRGSLGNLFSFSTVMDALASKQITYMRSTWDQLRSRFTNTAVNYDTKLRSLLKSLNAGENVVPLTKTSLPHIMPVLRLLERDWSAALDRDWSQTATKEVLDGLPTGELWEESASSYGLDLLLNHLQNAHMLAQQTNLYRINANAKLQKHPPDETLLDVFKTDLQLRLLWGSKATTENAVERYRLLEQVLSIMAQKMEFSGNSV